MQRFVVRKQFFEFRVGLVDIFRIAGQRHPAERAFSFAEQRTDVGRYKAREVEGVADTLIQRYLTDIVAVIHGRDAHMTEVEHCLHMDRH